MIRKAQTPPSKSPWAPLAGRRRPSPPEFAFLGKDVDFTKGGLVVEAQFSNYPFALNNIVRTTILMAERALLHEKPVSGLILITKGKMFPASQSTLYYEQAVKQMSALVKYGILAIPTRVVGLVENAGEVQAVWTKYTKSQHSRVTKAQKSVVVKIEEIGARCSLKLVQQD